MRAERRLPVGVTVGLLSTLVLVVLAADQAAASNVATGLQDDGGDLDVPTWLFLATGGAVIGASGLLATLVTDRAFVDTLHDWHRSLPLRVPRPLDLAAGTLGVALLVGVVALAITGPQLGNANFGVLVVFVGGRAGLVMLSYLLVNPYDALDPFRRIARVLPNGFVPYPERLGAWPAVGGLLALIWVEIVFPVIEEPSTLAAVVVCYTLYTVAGGLVFGPDDWFHYADPLAVLFRLFGAVAPIQRADRGFRFVLPGARLRDTDVVTGTGGVAFVLALVWELTYSGFVTTPPGVATVSWFAGLGIPPGAVYLLLLLGGFGAFVGAYWLATEWARRTADSYLSARYLSVRFAPPLLAIAAGYHLAHYFTFFLSLSPSLAAVLATPLSPPLPPIQLGLPGWMGGLDVAFVLAGHVLAVWAAHAASFAVFPGRLQAIRSQFPFVLVMILYTTVSLWLLSLPSVEPAFVG
ncbi:hypothetical protein [Natronorarus salvus]|uniref:hypothetical protein n=1 Tax=Natronorarus salvus TaxID=3117733 RepID=UPI002F26769B